MIDRHLYDSGMTLFEGSHQGRRLAQNFFRVHICFVIE
jgi:hypothetical protein